MASKLFRFFGPIVSLLSEKDRIKFLFFLKHNRFPSIESPKTFNEKVQYRKLYDRNPKFPLLADKIAVKSFISSLCANVKVPKILWQSDSLDDFIPDKLPEKFVLKANHASGTNLVITQQWMPTKTELKKLEKSWRAIAIDKTFVEWGYSQIPIRFFAEEFLDFDSFVPIDYKFWVFNGRIEFVQVDTDRYQGHKRAFYDRSWNKLPFRLTFPDVTEEPIRPKNFNEMIEVAELIADDLDFVRVDLYSDNVSVFFGEVTMYPGSGYEVFAPVSFDLDIGNLWNLKY